MKTVENFKFRDMVLQIGKKAIKEAQARSLANGVANVYSRDGVPYFQLHIAASCFHIILSHFYLFSITLLSVLSTLSISPPNFTNWFE